MKNRIILIGRIICAIAGIHGLVLPSIAGYFLALNVHQAWQNQSWNSVKGTILESRIESSSGDSATMFSPSVMYEYTIDDNTYTNNKISVDSAFSCSDINVAQKSVKNFPVGKTAEVFYDSNNPSNSVLITGLSHPIRTAICCVLDVVLLLFGLLFLVCAVKFKTFFDCYINFLRSIFKSFPNIIG